MVFNDLKITVGWHWHSHCIVFHKTTDGHLTGASQWRVAQVNPDKGVPTGISLINKRCAL